MKENPERNGTARRWKSGIALESKYIRKVCRSLLRLNFFQAIGIRRVLTPNGLALEGHADKKHALKLPFGLPGRKRVNPLDPNIAMATAKWAHRLVGWRWAEVEGVSGVGGGQRGG